MAQLTIRLDDELAEACKQEAAVEGQSLNGWAVTVLKTRTDPDFSGPGVERICDEVNRLLPDVRTIVATSDTLWSPEKAAEFVALVENKAVDIIIGTQLVTKGYHFPELTLVGVIDADPNYRPKIF